MTNELQAFAAKPTSGRAYFAGQSRDERLQTVRRLVRSDLRRLREWAQARRELIATCDAKPHLWVANAMDLSDEPMVRLAQTFSGAWTTFAVFVIAGSKAQARERFVAWRNDTGLDFCPLIPVQQAWWPARMKKAARALWRSLEVR